MEEFQLQHRHFLSELQLFQQNPTVRSKSFLDLVGFLAQVAPSYPHQLREFPQQLCELLEQQASVLHPETRIAIAKALVLLRNRDLLSATILLPLFFKMFSVPDKSLRTLLRNHIISDIRKINKKHKNQKLNAMLQNYMSVMLKESNEMAARHSIDVMIELYRKKIWNDERTVNVVAEACLAKNTKIIVSGLQFFLSTTTVEEDDDEEEPVHDPNANLRLQKMLHGHSKLTKKRKAKIQKYKNQVSKAQKKDEYLNPNFPAIQLIHDPLGFSEKLFGSLKRSTDRFEVKLMMMNLISRLIACHKLQLINFYPWVQRYLQPHQDQVTHILCILAQAVHDLIDADSILPTVRLIANNFVSDRCSSNAMAVGLNTIREICMRCPFAMDDTLLQDLVQYRKHKEKSVSMAARSLVTLYREVDPSMLAKKDRGRDAATVEARAFGQLRAQQGVDGAELLDEEDEEEDSEEDGEMDSDVDAEDDGDEEEEVVVEKKEKKKSLIQLMMEDEDDEDDEGEEDKIEADDVTVASSNISNLSTRSDAVRFLTDEDFARIDALKMARAMDGSRKRRRDEIEGEEATEELDESRLLAFIKKPKANYEERMASIREGREGRHFGSKRGDPERGSKTNEEKKKNQPFQLAKYSMAVRVKGKRSVAEKDRDRRKHVKKAAAQSRRRK